MIIRSLRRRVPWFLVSLLVAACGNPTPPSPASSVSLVATPAIPTPATPPTASAPASPGATGGGTPRPTLELPPRPPFEVGEYVWTVSHDLRVRSTPRVSADSVKYEPLLPVGTQLFLTDGPEAASGYWWYKVRLETMELRGGISVGWVASGDHDGTPWIGYDGLQGPDTEPIPDSDLPPLPDPVLVLEGTEEFVGSDGNPYSRYAMSITNWAEYPAELFDPAPDLPPCGLNPNAGRTWVNVYGGPEEEYIYGFCAITDPRDLLDLSVMSGRPPEVVFVQIWDRGTDREAYSNHVTP